MLFPGLAKGVLEVTSTTIATTSGVADVQDWSFNEVGGTGVDPLAAAPSELGPLVLDRHCDMPRPTLTLLRWWRRHCLGEFALKV